VAKKDQEMADYMETSHVTDDLKPEFVEYEKANRAVLDDPDDFDAWEKLVRTTEQLEGGLTRNSSPQAIAATRAVFDRFLAKFPLLFGYWKKYADLEFSLAGTEAAEMVFLIFNFYLPPPCLLLRVEK
jgi:pre-mRNA-processing factor 39